MVGRKAKRSKRLTQNQKDEAAKNFPLAVNIATKMGDLGIPDMDDQIQEGALGLCDYTKIKFDTKRGLQKSTLASRCIRNRILNARRGYGLIRIPAHLQDKTAANHPNQKYVVQAEKRVSVDNILKGSRFHPVDPGDEETEFGYQALRAVRWAVQKLPPMERDVIRSLVLREDRLSTVCKKYGVSYSAINRIKAEALAKLRTSLVRHV